MPTIELHNPHHDEGIAAMVQAPAGSPRGTIILLQEIFGLDHNMCADADRWVAAGFHVIMPSLFDRVQRGFLAKHDKAGFAAGFAAMGETPDEQAIDDVRACIGWAKINAEGPIFVIGYCYGGRLAWLAANGCDGIAGAAVYYGDVLRHADVAPRCPLICHFGGKDPFLPGERFVNGIRDRHPTVPAHNYANSGHGFNNSGTPDADPRDADLARRRTLAFFSAIS
ncbi:dienelactone hydrolase family protein [Sphingobium sp. MK2]|uniref:dienelactone hydrolase family protein n=1 Tax=Sphingobium sp. MK2 TaxID=3116540 RepID=UPI0032E36246